ncbi:hypothetical protein FRC09_017767, partial [Ceratobasidium sp. 395]
MPPLGWRKAVDGAKGKGKQSANPLVYNNPPPVPERTGVALKALGGTSFGGQPGSEQGSRLPSVRPEEANFTMDVDDPSNESTPAPGSAVPQGSSSEHTSNAGMTPPIRSIKLKLKVKATPVDSPPPERPAPTRGRGRGGRGRGGRGRGRGGRARKIILEPSPSPSSEEESAPEEPAPVESEDEASEMASDQEDPVNVTLNTVNDELEDDDEQDQDAEAEVDPDAPGEMDEDLDDLDAPGEIDEDIDPLSLSTINRSKLTARQAALVAGGSTMSHVMLPEAPSRKAQRTEAEIALRRSETARKRKHQDAQRLEDEKTETINRLLKKQSVKARNKKALETLLGDPTAEDATNMIADNRPAVPCYRWVSSSKDASMSLSFSLPDTTNGPQIVAENS